MKLGDALGKMNCSDIFDAERGQFEKLKDGTIQNKSCGTIVRLSEESINLDGEIIPAEPKVYPSLTVARSCIDENRDPTALEVALVTEGEKNGHLKEYQRPEQVELRREIKNCPIKCVVGMNREQTDWFVRITEALKAVKPPTEHIENQIDRSHEECEDCALLKLQPPECSGHAYGPSPCLKFIEKPAPESEKVFSVKEIAESVTGLEDIKSNQWHSSDCREWNIAVASIKTAQENYRLERDLELRELVDTVQIIRDQFGGQDIGGHMAYLFQLYNNLKPLKA